MMEKEDETKVAYNYRTGLTCGYNEMLWAHVGKYQTMLTFETRL